jgi:hypothetical protein
MKPMIPAVLFAFFGILQPLFLYAQGSLTPPGPPGPTMKSLDQIEARTAITNDSSLVTILQPGTYYLTRNLTVNTGDAIEIATNDVTLNLNGFTIASTAASANGTAINLNNPATNSDIKILNGHIKSGVTYNGSSYVGPGFANGIAFPGTLQPLNVHVEDISVSGCSGNGIYLGVNNSALVEACMVQNIGNDGITAGIITRSTANTCGSEAVFCNVASDCIGSSTGGVGTGVAAYDTAMNCQGINTGNGYGLQALNVANHCSGQSVGGTGVSVGSIADGCYGFSTTGTGLVAFIANGCHGATTSGTALSVTHNVNSF